MSEHHINDPQPTPDAPASVDVSAQALASARRRRFIKMGSGIVPVALTLASRPVLATNCVTASAWGSAVGAAGTLVTGTSSYARSQRKITGISGAFTQAKWKKLNTTTNYPSEARWDKIANCNTYAEVQVYSVNSLTGGVGISGMLNTASVWSCLQTTDEANKYKRAMCVAWLNLKVSNSSSCLTDPLRPTYNALISFSKMGSGGGTGPDGKFWSQEAVLNYMYNNYVSR